MNIIMKNTLELIKLNKKMKDLCFKRAEVSKEFRTKLNKYSKYSQGDIVFLKNNNKYYSCSIFTIDLIGDSIKYMIDNCYIESGKYHSENDLFSIRDLINIRPVDKVKEHVDFCLEKINKASGINAANLTKEQIKYNYIFLLDI